MTTKITIKDYRDYLEFKKQYYEDCLRVLEFNFEEKVKEYNNLPWFYKLFTFKPKKGFEYKDEKWHLKQCLRNTNKELEMLWYEENRSGHTIVVFQSRPPEEFYTYWYKKENVDAQSTD